ncbi:ABC transporter permease [Cytobacillus sp. IB215665]|uniref:ABC transporter permease n=1 Tax=Cytobacillus sp. IB215665 TaxID=3097357 RepID=UPI002A1476B5|nr:ABC transporter permease [Cytobacillus sp. IB215665]MDX8366359.1 ABC transporter permease [Cytobacillus sp. IB215665]
MNTDPMIQDKRFQPLDKSIYKADQDKQYKSMSFSQDVWRRLKKHKPAMISLFFLVVITFMAFAGPYMNEHEADYQNYDSIKMEPTMENDYWFGTDTLGRDMWTRTWEGAKISLLIGVVAATLDVIFGVVYGAISGYFGGRIDFIMMRFIEIIVSIPNIIFTILLLMVIERGILAIIIAIALTGWVGMARLIRGQVMSLKSREYVLAARSLGSKPMKLIRVHLIPNMVGPMMVNMSFTIPAAIFAEAVLSFIGLGVPLPDASLGSLVNDGRKLLLLEPHLLFFPATIITLIILSFSIFGDGLRDAVDPRLRK